MITSLKLFQKVIWQLSNYLIGSVLILFEGILAQRPDDRITVESQECLLLFGSHRGTALLKLLA